jgi:ribokinase
MSGRVVVLGSLNVDLVTRVERHPRPGETVLGDGLSSWPGARARTRRWRQLRPVRRWRWSGASGTTPAARPTGAGSSGSGVDVAGVRVSAGVPTGHAIVTVADGGENSIVVIPGANDLVDEREVAAVDGLGPGDVLLVQLEVPRAVVCAAVRRAAGRGARVVLNTAPYAALPPDVVALADPVVANEHEMAALAEAGAEPRSLLVTFGANGAAWDAVTTPAHVVPSGEVVDTTGAGDAFCGALAAALAHGASRGEALDAALAAGAAAVRHPGAQPDPPSCPEPLSGGLPPFCEGAVRWGRRRALSAARPPGSGSPWPGRRRRPCVRSAAGGATRRRRGGCRVS